MKETTAGRLLRELSKESAALRDAVATAAGILPERAARAMTGDVALTLAEQLRLAEAAVLCAPGHARQALRLRAQALAARSFEDGVTATSIASPAERWERSSQLRR
jgi:hypothetical protein